MPTYDYACTTCGIFEVFQSIKEDALTVCPTCKKKGLSRLMGGGGGIIFKGEGFWETDYNRSKDYKAKSKADGAPTPAAEVAKPDAKPDAKPQPQPQAQTKLAEAPKPATKPTTPPASP